MAVDVTYKKGDGKDRPLTTLTVEFESAFLGKGWWHKMPLKFFQLMKPDEAHVLAYLYNMRRMFEPKGKLQKIGRSDGCFYCATERMEQALGYTRKTQWQILKRLGLGEPPEKPGLLYVRCIIVARKRFIWLNLRKLMADARKIKPDNDPWNGILDEDYV